MAFKYSIVCVLALVSSRALAQVDHGHALIKPDHRPDANALVKVVRESTERFKDVALADAEGYKLKFGCVSGPDSGAMGLHFVNGDLVGEGEIDATRPEIVIYEPLPNGRLRLIGADYLVLADAWNGTRRTKHLQSSWDSCFICSRAPIASGCRRSTRCMSGRGRKTPPALS
jgi:hypothetical protein